MTFVETQAQTRPQHTLLPSAWRRLLITVKLAFFLSGMAALFYQLIWVRLLSTFFGNTTLALAVCLSAFMSGLALGSYAFGRWAVGRPSPFRLYAALEIAIGLYGVLSPELIRLVRAAYLSLAAGRPLDSPALVGFEFVSCFLVLLLPTALMGGTLPVLSRGVVRRLEETGRDIAWLYGINTVGAAAGALLVGFFLLPTVGLHASLLLAAGLNLLAGLAVLLRQPGGEAATQPPPAEPAPAEASSVPPAPLVPRLLLIGFGLSGFAGLALEVAWGRALCLYTGSSIYAFSAVLFSVLVGLALGSLAVARLAARRPITLSWFAEIEMLAGLTTVLLALGYNYLPVVFYFLVSRFQHTYPLLLSLQVAVILLYLLPPTLLAGASFPVVARLWVRDSATLSRGIGALYAANTGGCLLGAALTGFLLIPRLGLHTTVLLCAGLYVLVGVAVLLAGRTHRPALGVAVLAVFLVAAGALPDWRHDLMSLGLFHGTETTDILNTEWFKMVYYREGSTCTVAVADVAPEPGTTEPVRVLKVNGKVDASTNPADTGTQEMSAHLPLLLADRTDSALVVGLGCGATAGAALLHPVSRIDCVEIEPAVAEGARYFANLNHGVLTNHRFHLVLADGRNYLAATGRRYDVITSEPSNPWVAGVASLFTVEHFQACRDALAEDGLVCQWLHLYSMHPEDVASIIGSFVKVFPNATLWGADESGSDAMLIARKHPWKVDYPALEARLRARPEVAASLRRAGLPDGLQVLASLLRGPEELRRLTRNARLNTDDLPRLEFRAPRYLYWEDTYSANFRFLSRVSPQPLDTFVTFGPPRDARTRELLADRFLTRFDTGSKDIPVPSFPWARAELTAAVALEPTRPSLYQKLARVEEVMGDHAAAARHARRAAELAR